MAFGGSEMALHGINKWVCVLSSHAVGWLVRKKNIFGAIFDLGGGILGTQSSSRSEYSADTGAVWRAAESGEDPDRPRAAGFDFSGVLNCANQSKRTLPANMIRSRLNPKGLIAYPTDKSIRRFRNRVRALTRPCAPLRPKS